MAPSSSNKRTTGRIMLVLVALLHILIYYHYVIQLWAPRVELNAYVALPVLILFHIFMIMFSWSYILTAAKSPGTVPLYWGFRIGDPDERRRKYCLICNVYKPDRTHHCSTCGDCILNMDHHCQWLNNCIGFANRKSFMVMLFYLECVLIYIAVTMLPDFIKGVIWLKQELWELNYSHGWKIFSAICSIAVFLAMIIFSVVVHFFHGFHKRIVLENKTTLEHLGNKSMPFDSVYDLEEEENYKQVMGTSYWLTWLPINPLFAQHENRGMYFKKNAETEPSDEGEEYETEDAEEAYETEDVENNLKENTIPPKPNLTSHSSLNLDDISQPSELLQTSSNAINPLMVNGTIVSLKELTNTISERTKKPDSSRTHKLTEHSRTSSSAPFAQHS